MYDLQPTLIGIAGTPVTAALTSVLIKPFVTDKRFYPLASLLIGVAFNLALALVFDLPLLNAALLGVLAGLAASGAYSAGKTLSHARPASRAAQPNDFSN